MNKRIIRLLTAACLCVLLCIPVLADTIPSQNGWKVTFTPGETMVSNFKTSDLDEAVAGLQPGDDITFHLELSNEHSSVTNWYMTNEVLYSLEDRSTNNNTSGGAYTYELDYVGPSGETIVLFSSDTVGGEYISAAGEGLHQATDALKDYFFLDTLEPGQKGRISLKVALDGETQGNDYQDTLADLQMNFAVELSAATTTPPSTTPTPPSTSRPPTTTTNTPPTIVKTGDETNLIPYLIAMGVSGVLLLCLGFYSIKKRRSQGNGGA